ncbi:unnamed protein product [Adineta steineri]|uniref:G-protein coupled receptors family 1 profile domain-containing protein n=1 Tax=Adineta steineri TaxID=433720 RepID=A0A814WSQ8_9BILA|nr:unnamed protein product [Adineta steineri]CAF1206423.1 unnamed protein product [Adineta steineri]
MNTTVDFAQDDMNGSLSDDWENYKAYTRFYYITDEVFLYANPVLVLIGIPTHALSMIIFLRKRMRRYPVSVFMAMLSLTNILILAGPVTMQWLNHKVFIGFVVTGSRFLCAFHVYIDLVGSSINSWLILMIAVERYLSVTKPFLIRTSFNRRQAWIIVFSVALVALIAPLGLAIVASKVNGCLLFFSRTYQIIGSIQIFFIYVLPSIFILTLSIITVHKLRNRIRASGPRRIHISVMLIGVSFSFITFTMPYQICWYWLFSTAISRADINLKVNIINIGLRYLALTIRNLNYTLNFFLYSLTSTVFLKEAFTIAHCNFFLNQRFIERNPAFNGLRRFFTLADEQREQQQVNGLINQDNPDNENNNHNYQTFSKHLNQQLLQNDTKTLNNEFLNGHLNSNTTKTNVSIDLKQLTIKPKQKKLKWNLKPMKQQTLSSHHLHLNDDDQLQQYSSPSSNHTSTTNISEINNKIHE